MNARIQELAEQAVEFSLFNVNRDSHFFTSIAMEKFAELLIQECANIDYKNASDGKFSNDDSYLISKVIKQHFGVEE